MFKMLSLQLKHIDLNMCFKILKSIEQIQNKKHEKKVFRVFNGQSHMFGLSIFSTQKYNRKITF